MLSIHDVRAWTESGAWLVLRSKRWQSPPQEGHVAIESDPDLLPSGRREAHPTAASSLPPSLPSVTIQDALRLPPRSHSTPSIVPSIHPIYPASLYSAHSITTHGRAVLPLVYTIPPFVFCSS